MRKVRLQCPHCPHAKASDSREAAAETATTWRCKLCVRSFKDSNTTVASPSARAPPAQTGRVTRSRTLAAAAGRPEGQNKKKKHSKLGSFNTDPVR